tara:strand:- start:709 stop:918 length:210 start_codon:yes stop_codon:yes gene_type:complete
LEPLRGDRQTDKTHGLSRAAKLADSAAFDPPQAQTAGFHILRIEEPRAQLKVNGCGVVPRSERGKGNGR